MTFRWPALKAVLDPHTVETPRGRLAGFLVRCTASRKDLGYVWRADGVWGWRTPDGAHFGERVTQRAAVEVLRDAYDLANGGAARRLPFDTADTLEAVREVREATAAIAAKLAAKLPPMKPRRDDSAPRVVTPKPAPPPPPVRKIVWGPAPTTDVTAALAAAFRRREEK